MGLGRASKNTGDWWTQSSTSNGGHHSWKYVPRVTWRITCRGIAPRIETCTCGASRRCGSIAAKYYTVKPAPGRSFSTHRSSSFAKCIAYNAARR